MVVIEFCVILTTSELMHEHLSIACAKNEPLVIRTVLIQKKYPTRNCVLNSYHCNTSKIGYGASSEVK